MSEAISYELVPNGMPAAILARLPDPDRAIPAVEPEHIRPASFNELQAEEAALQAGTKVLARDEHSANLYRFRKNHLRYAQVTPDEFIAEAKIRDLPFVCEPAEFPHAIPADAEHYVLWIHNPHTPQTEVAWELARRLGRTGKTLDDIVLNEPPRIVAPETTEANDIRIVLNDDPEFYTTVIVWDEPEPFLLLYQGTVPDVFSLHKIKQAPGVLFVDTIRADPFAVTNYRNSYIDLFEVTLLPIYLKNIVVLPGNNNEGDANPLAGRVASLPEWRHVHMYVRAG